MARPRLDEEERRGANGRRAGHSSRGCRAAGASAGGAAPTLRYGPAGDSAPRLRLGVLVRCTSGSRDETICLVSVGLGFEPQRCEKLL